MEVDQVVARWDAEEKAVRARLLAPDAAPQEQVASRTGMEVFEAIFAGELPPTPIGDTLDFVPIHMEPGATTPWVPCMVAGLPRCSTRRWAVLCIRHYLPARVSPRWSSKSTWCAP